jgi:hypothetical protein
MSNTFRISPDVRLKRVASAVRKSQAGNMTNCLVPLAKGDAKFLLQMLSDALAKTETDKEATAT